MNETGNPEPVQALFVADAHFRVHPDGAERLRQERFLALLDCARRADHLVLLGDIFDFWFDYPHFVLKGYEPLLRGLDHVRDAGTRIHFVGGNHDIWAAPYLHERFGSSPEGGPVTLVLGATRIHCIHGDGILGKELVYRTFRTVVRHRLGIRLAKAWHPETLFAFSTWLSGHSRAATRDEAQGIETKAATFLARAAQASPDWDVMLMGHVHHAFQLTSGPHTLLSLGGWLDDLNYCRFVAGRLERAVFRPDGDILAG